jgi:hypothetical protein
VTKKQNPIYKVKEAHESSEKPTVGNQRGADVARKYTDSFGNEVKQSPLPI